jgi:probable phosphoglycerate mutase
MTRVILIRHAETPWNRERRMQGHIDTPLSDAGRAQAAALGRRLADGAFNALYSSDLCRARETARAIAERSGREVVSDARLRERSFGIFEGLTYAEMAERHPEDFARFDARDPDYVMPGGESARAFWERCLACLGEIGERHAGAEVVVVTHGLVLDAVYREAHGLGYHEPRPVPLVNASINAFSYEDGMWRMESWGDVGHLDPALVTRYEGRAR